MARNLLVASFFASLALALAGPAIDGRIAGGYVPRTDRFTYQVAIHLKVPEPFVELQDDFCSGSLISQNYVLTAASCLAKAESATIILGSHKIDAPVEGQIIVESSEFIIPDKFDSAIGAGYEWNLALIKLSEPVELSETLQPVRLADNDEDYAGDVAEVAGWGATYAAQFVAEPELRWIESVVLSYRQCIKNNPWYKQVVVEGSHICQLAETKSACRGDTGAPLTIDNVQIGLAAYTPGNCFRQAPVIYVRVANYIDWIRENSDI